MESELRLPSALECFRSGEEECRGAFAVPREVVVAVDAPAAVSYTHLDVYKRQAMRRAMELLSDKEALRTMSENLEKLARPDAAERIVDEIEKVMK